MNPSAPSFLDLLRSRPVLAVPAPRSQDVRIKCMFIVQRYVYRAKVRLMPAGFCTANVVSDTHHRVGVSDSEGRGGSRLIRSSRTLRQASLLTGLYRSSK
jgi:hypothetical protein